MHGANSARVAALDGMRAAAIMAVLLFHGGVDWLSGGSQVSTRSSC
jgi:peptidoglycan/LPS O-acetylase OafA/YrhL